MNPLLFNSALPGHRRSLYSHVRHPTYQFSILYLSPHSKLGDTLLLQQMKHQTESRINPRFLHPYKIQGELSTEITHHHNPGHNVI